MLQQSGIVHLRVVVVVQFAVDEVAKVGGVVGQVELFEKPDKVVEIQNQSVVLEQMEQKIMNDYFQDLDIDCKSL